MHEPTCSPPEFPWIFLTGATGYIGGRLAPRLLEKGYRIRCLARSASKLRARPWSSAAGVEIVEGDVANEEWLTGVLQGCDAAYYLVHSMDAAGGGEYRSRDLALAESFGRACAKAGVKRIVYLGGLGETGDGLSDHLTSRREVEKALTSGGVPVTVLRAAMIIGSGSASFEILRYLVERLPIMVTPRWVSTESQPISVRDVLFYLIAVLEVEETAGKAIDIGGPDVRNYAEIMREMASAVGLRPRLVIPVPVLTPRLSSLWIHLITPLHASIARPLAEGLRNRVVCRNDDAVRLMPHQCLTIRQAIDASLMKIDTGTVETSWSDAGVMPGDPSWAGGTVFFGSARGNDSCLPSNGLVRGFVDRGQARLPWRGLAVAYPRRDGYACGRAWPSAWAPRRSRFAFGRLARFLEGIEYLGAKEPGIDSRNETSGSCHPDVRDLSGNGRSQIDDHGSLPPPRTIRDRLLVHG